MKRYHYFFIVKGKFIEREELLEVKKDKCEKPL